MTSLCSFGRSGRARTRAPTTSHLTDLERTPDRSPVPHDWTYAPAAETYTTINPATEEPLAEVGQATPAEVGRAVAAAREAFEDGWSKRSPSERAKYLFRIARLLQGRWREVAVLQSLNGGKPIKESR